MNKLNRLLFSGLLCLTLSACDDDETVIQAPAEDPTAFKFRSDSIADYVRVDRMGGPATTTALLMPGPAGGNRRQQANLTEPVDDGQFAPEYVATLKTLHFELGPVLQGLGLDACGVPGANVATTNVDDCVTVAAPLVIPDVLRLDTSQPSGFPNGRDLDDQVVDLLLAVALLDLGTHPLRLFADLPLNPPASVPGPLAVFPFFNNQALAAPPAASP
jgi:hypothetical protein